MAGRGLHIVASAQLPILGAPLDPLVYQASCIEAYQASQTARGFSPVTIGNGTGVLERFLDACGCPAWEVTCEDVDRVVGQLAAAGMSASTRRGYVSAFKGFFVFLAARKAAEIEACFGVRLADPVDEFNAARHVGADSPQSRPPPTPARGEGFFAFLRQRVATARVFAAPAGTTRFTGRCITPGCGPRKPSRSMSPTCTLTAGHSARSTCGSARRPGDRGRGHAGSRCWTSST